MLYQRIGELELLCHSSETEWLWYTLGVTFQLMIIKIALLFSPSRCLISFFPSSSPLCSLEVVSSLRHSLHHNLLLLPALFLAPLALDTWLSCSAFTVFFSFPLSFLHIDRNMFLCLSVCPPPLYNPFIEILQTWRKHSLGLKDKLIGCWWSEVRVAPHASHASHACYHGISGMLRFLCCPKGRLHCHIITFGKNTFQSIIKHLYGRKKGELTLLPGV